MGFEKNHLRFTFISRLLLVLFIFSSRGSTWAASPALVQPEMTWVSLGSSKYAGGGQSFLYRVGQR